MDLNFLAVSLVFTHWNYKHNSKNQSFFLSFFLPTAIIISRQPSSLHTLSDIIVVIIICQKANEIKAGSFNLVTVFSRWVGEEREVAKPVLHANGWWIGRYGHRVFLLPCFLFILFYFLNVLGFYYYGRADMSIGYWLTRALLWTSSFSRQTILAYKGNNQDKQTELKR